MPILLGALASAIRKRFYDNFAGRVNTTGGLGIATDGSQWTAVNGTIQVTSGAATATTTPTSGGAGTTYPMAVVNMPTTDNKISLSGTQQGSAAAIWVQSSSDWWMVGQDIGTTYVPGNYVAGNYVTGWNAGNYNNTQNANNNTQNTVTQNANNNTQNTNNSNNTNYNNYTNIGGGVWVASGSSWNIIAWNAVTWNVNNGGTWNAGTWNVNNGGTWNAGTFNGNSYAYNNSYTNAAYTNYDQILRVLKSVGGTVSTMQSWIISQATSFAAIASKIASFSVQTTGSSEIRTKIYSDSSLVTQIGADLVYNPIGAIITTQYGIAIEPSANNQSAVAATKIDIIRN